MIRIEKPASIPAVLQKSTERKRVIEYYEGGCKGKKVDYKDYRDVKEDLIKIFNGKCAYCEHEIISTSSGDVEHFRPKNEVFTQDEETKTGYYWLGADWSNLILSCELCNRKRLHEIPEEEKKLPLGKQSQFPLSNENFRCKDHNDHTNQEEDYRLLLHPCIDNPEEHLEFDIEGLIYPREITPGNESPKGIATIMVVALLRKPLIDARKSHYLEKMQLHLKELEDLNAAHENAKALGNQMMMDFCRKMITEKLVHFQTLLQPTGEFLAMTRQLLLPVLEKYGVKTL